MEGVRDTAPHGKEQQLRPHAGRGRWRGRAAAARKTKQWSRAHFPTILVYLVLSFGSLSGHFPVTLTRYGQFRGVHLVTRNSVYVHAERCSLWPVFRSLPPSLSLSSAAALEPPEPLLGNRREGKGGRSRAGGSRELPRDRHCCAVSPEWGATAFARRANARRRRVLNILRGPSCAAPGRALAPRSLPRRAGRGLCRPPCIGRVVLQLHPPRNAATRASEAESGAGLLQSASAASR